MKQELDDQLVANYPELFATVKHTECGDGWYPILDTLCRKIQGRLRFAKCDPVLVEQIKEKFGELRFYYTGGDATIAGMVMMAESMSEVTCEVCGDRGTLRTGGWMKTLCDHHHEEREQARLNAP
jgi:hypothetical protein